MKPDADMVMRKLAQNPSFCPKKGPYIKDGKVVIFK
jgi:hypothetical protein